MSHLTQACGTEADARVTLLAEPGRRLNMRQLRTFLALERQGDTSMAAEALGVGQVNVNNTLRQIETVLGEELLRRNGRLVSPTVAGERLARGAGVAVAEFRAALEDLESYQHDGYGRLLVGTLPLPSAEFLPQVIARFSAARSSQYVEVAEGSYLELMGKLRGGEIDILLGGLRRVAPPEDLEQTVLFEEDLFVVGSSRHPLVGSDASVAALSRYPWIVAPAGSPVRIAWESLFAGGERPGKLVQCASAASIRGLLLADDWLALISLGQFRLERDAGLLRTIGEPLKGPRRRLGMFTRRHWQPTRSQREFVDLLREAAADFV